MTTSKSVIVSILNTYTSSVATLISIKKLSQKKMQQNRDYGDTAKCNVAEASDIKAGNYNLPIVE